MFGSLTLRSSWATHDGMIDSKILYRQLGERLAERRTQLKLRQDDVANQIGLTRTSITNIERGRQKILVHHLYALAQALATTPSRLLPKLDEVAETRIEEFEQVRRFSETERKWILGVVKGAIGKDNKQGGQE
jgi:transcriptional regulator with XRE-family HTH domain